MLFTTETFTAEMIAGLGRGPFRLHDEIFDVRATCFLPVRSGTWRRIQGLDPAIRRMRSVSDYWRARSAHFFYLYARDPGVLCAAGYFDNPYIARFADTAALDHFKPFENDVQRAVFERFLAEDGPLIRSWYPTLPSMVDLYDLSKNLSVARDIAAHASSGEPVRVLEIGAGGCLLALMLRRLLPVARYDIIDLPFVMPLGTAILDAVAPEVAISLPGDSAGEAGGEGAEIRFHLADEHLVHSQDHHENRSGAGGLADASVDIAVNVTSFGEMEPDQVAAYFDTIARVLRPGGVFICLNREDKVTRFDDYPWDRLPGEILMDRADPFSFYHGEWQSLRRRIVRPR